MCFHEAVEASLNCCLVEPLVSFTQKRSDKEISVCFPSPRGVERKGSSALRKLFLWEWSDVLETLSVPVGANLLEISSVKKISWVRVLYGGRYRTIGRTLTLCFDI